MDVRGQKFLLMFAAVGLIGWSAPTGLRADFIPIPSPFTPNYLTSTTLLYPGPAGVDLTSLSDSALTITFSNNNPNSISPRTTAAVGAGWGSWSSPPQSEGPPTPPGPPLIVLAPNPFDFLFPITPPHVLTLTFSDALSTFGFEAEPDDLTPFPGDAHDITANFYDGSTLVGTITRNVHGNAGALLFAAMDGTLSSESIGITSVVQFTSVQISSNVGFAIANLRYAGAAVPEPSSLAMLLGAGVVGLIWTVRRRRNPAAA
jgi:hypothetical protein